MLKDWVEVKLGEILNIERGGSPRPIKDFITNEENGINWIKIGDTKNVSKYIYSTAEKIKPEGLKKTRIVNEGDFLLSNSMSFGRPYIMKTNGAIHDGWLVLKDKENFKIEVDYLYHVLSSPYVFTQFDKFATGSTVKNLNTDLVSKVQIPLAPLPEQRAIASKIEQLFSELDNGIANLKTAKSKLEIYRQAILKQAFEGNLTKDWRKKQPKNHGNHVNQKNHSADNLPETWQWVKLGDICTKITDGTHHTPKYISEGVPFISVKDVRNYKIDFSNTKFISKEEHNELIKRCFPEEGDILITKSGTIGRLAIVPNIEFSLFVSVALLKIQ